MFKYRQIIAFVLLGAALLLPYLGLAVVWNHSVTKKQVKRELSSVVGSQNLFADCQKQVQGELAQGGGVVNSMTQQSVIRKGNTVEIVFKLDSNIFTGIAHCTFKKGLYQLTDDGPGK